MSTPARIELGCGGAKRPGFFGLDIQAGPHVDLVFNFERDPLPFPDSSVEHVYSSHAFEHLEASGSPIPILREIVRVAKPNATVEIWTPYGKSNDGLLFGHRNFYTETHWKHICFQADDFYLGAAPGRFEWIKTQYVVPPEVRDRLAALGIALDFGIEHMFNVAVEMGVFLRVDKLATKARSPQDPIREYCFPRGQPLPPVRLTGMLPGLGGDLRRALGRVRRALRHRLRGER